ncbi:MAG: radical SAM protein [Planctomycetaceae bacterium]|jgi:L-lysine 2,3-aminomutase|nr:radical SAM protein [Planctomycetaceae bacterium]
MSNEFITEIDELIRILNLADSVRDNIIYDSDYPLFVPRDFVNLMESGNICDPLLIQVLPRIEENNTTAAGFVCNPFDENINTELTVLKKYRGRALLILTRKCGIHCRFCFRRHILRNFVSQQNLLITSKSEFESELKLKTESKSESESADCESDKFESDIEIESTFDSIMSDKNINEVILSGGDPLIQSDEKIKIVLDYIEKIPHVKRIRIHSRFPVVMPKRITENLNTIFKREKPIYLVLHVNHPNELSDDFLLRLKLLNAPIILSQTVLLKGVNDNADVLVKLFEKLVDNRVIPYYLHQLDRIKGAAHFEVNVDKGCKIVSCLYERLSGYAVPKYVQEIAGGICKKILI